MLPILEGRFEIERILRHPFAPAGVQILVDANDLVAGAERRKPRATEIFIGRRRAGETDLVRHASGPAERLQRRRGATALVEHLRLETIGLSESPATMQRLVRDREELRSFGIG